jgi:hypothetical protein
VVSNGHEQRDPVHALIARETLGPSALIGTAGWLQWLCADIDDQLRLWSGCCVDQLPTLDPPL